MRTARSEQAALRGDRVLTLSEDLPDAMRALRQARHEVVGEPLRGVLTPETQDCVSAEHYRYLEEMVEEGIPSRREYPRKRVRAEPYPSHGRMPSGASSCTAPTPPRRRLRT